MSIRTSIFALLSLAPAAASTPARAREADCVSRSRSAVVAVVAGTCITAEEVDAAIARRMPQGRADDYNLKLSTLEGLIGARLLELEAKARGVKIDQLARAEIDGKVAPVTEAEVEEMMVRIRREAPAENVEVARVRQALNDRRLAERKLAFVQQLRERAEVDVRLQPPRALLAADKGPSRGPRHAPVTIVVYSEFECPFCARSSLVLKEIEGRYGDKVRIVFRHFPRPMHQHAAKAAEAAMCAEDQGRFWELHDKLFASQPALAVADLKRYAVEVGLDAEAFGRCLDSGRRAEAVAAEAAEGARHGVQRVPTFFVNGRYLLGAAPLDAFVPIIDDELARAKMRPPAPATDAAAKSGSSPR
jgi:protein-disulfide isomerase